MSGWWTSVHQCVRRCAPLAIVMLMVSSRPAIAEDGSPHAIRVGVKECAACHTQPGLLYPKLGVTQFLHLTEAASWFHQDKHAFAYELVRQDLPIDAWEQPERLSNRRTRSILERLGWQPTDGRFEKHCLSCHAGLEPTDTRSDPWVTENVALGVQCETCHGPGSQYMQVDRHQQSSWRALGPDAKAKLGMQDLTNPASCAQVCLSCHLGDLARNRFVTHAMYAAGHPPLPPFELQTFLNAMPKHWVDLEDKPIRTGDAAPASFEFQEDYYRAHFEFDPSAARVPMKEQRNRSMNRMQRSRIAIEVTRDASHQLLVDAATLPEVWGDYALFDCMGCHQLLTSARPRYRPEGRIPGRAFPPLWVDHASTGPLFDPKGDTEYASIVQKGFTEVFNRRPFGDADAMLAISKTLESQSVQRSQLLVREGRRLLPPEDARAWLAQWLRERRRMLGDYWVARQTGWVVIIALQEMAEKDLWEETSVREIKSELTELLHLELRIPPQESVLKQQASVLETAHQYDIERVTAILDAVQSQLQRP